MSPAPSSSPPAADSPRSPGEPVDADEPGLPTPAPVPLVEPREGIPPVITSSETLLDMVDAFAAGDGPVAVDAERASGYRYGQRAYLVQLRRNGVGTALIDPIACADLAPLGDALVDAEWVLHAASQDLPCLAEVGMRPRRLFDTELSGRLLGLPRVGLGPMVEQVLGFALEKGHSAADWSTRPLPEPWLRYAALDVEVLIELRDALAEMLRSQGKLAWAEEEFAAIVASPPATPRRDPWRRTSGLHRVRKRRQLAVVRSMWETRERLARSRDIAPGRILPDSAIVAAAVGAPADVRELTALPVFGGRATRRSADTWFAAIQRARDLPEDDLPLPSTPLDGPPPARSWADRDPQAAARLAAVRAAVAAVADEHGLPTENLLSPDAVRRLCWQPPAEITPESVAGFLEGRGARSWQIGLTRAAIVGALERAGTVAP